MQRILLTGTLVLLSILVFAQQPEGPTPGQLLRLARSTYEQGRLHEVEGQLTPVLSNLSTTKPERVEAYKLLCLANIYLEEPGKADEAMLNILRTDPYFKINPAVDPAEFVALYYTFRTTEIYRIGAKLGVNATQPSVSEAVFAVDEKDGTKYKYLIAFQFGANIDVPVPNSLRLTLHGEILFQSKRFQIDVIANRFDDLSGQPLDNTFSGQETMNWISLPITVEYAFGNITRDRRPKYNPYVAAGVDVGYLLSSSISADRLRDDQASIEPRSWDPLREKLNISAVGAAGIKLRVAGGYFIAEARYTHGFTNVTTKESAFSNPQITLEYGYADSIFKLRSVSITGAYVHNIFNPKKKRIHK